MKPIYKAMVYDKKDKKQAKGISMGMPTQAPKPKVPAMGKKIAANATMRTIYKKGKNC